NFVQSFKETSVKLSEAYLILEANGSERMKQPDKMFKVFSRPQLDFDDIVQFIKVEEYVAVQNLDKQILDQAFIQVIYSGYIEKEKSNADKLTRLEDVRIPENFDYDKIKSMSFEAKDKLKKIRPVTISQASRISFVAPSDISILLIHMGR